MNKTGLSILTMFGVGYIEKAPGTFASLLTCLLYYILFFLEVNFFIYIAIFNILLVISFFLILIQSPALKKNDPKEIVIDEFFGQSIPFLFIWFRAEWYNISTTKFHISIFILSFIFFRLFDIWKPFPINLIDKKIKNAFGIIFDDIFAGIYALILLWFVVWGYHDLTPPFVVPTFWKFAL